MGLSHLRIYEKSINLWQAWTIGGILCDIEPDMINMSDRLLPFIRSHITGCDQIVSQHLIRYYKIHGQCVIEVSAEHHQISLQVLNQTFLDMWLNITRFLTCCLDIHFNVIPLDIPGCTTIVSWLVYRIWIFFGSLKLGTSILFSAVSEWPV